MSITMHNANLLDQRLSGNAAMAGLNDRVHGETDLRAHRLSPNRMRPQPNATEGKRSFLPVRGKPSFGRPAGTGHKPAPSAEPTSVGYSQAERMPAAVPTSSPLPPAAWAALIIHGAGSCAGRAKPRARVGTPETVAC